MDILQCTFHNRHSVLSALTSVQQRLKLYRKLPTNGLVLFCGEGRDENDDASRTKRILVDFEPFSKISRSTYLCDSKFHVGELRSMLEAQEGDAYGFVVVDGRYSYLAQNWTKFYFDN